jgi:putative methionine-R-sulfoxide reductase with GAF domain
MAQLIADHFAVDFCAIYLLERRTDELVLEASAGQSGLTGERLPFGHELSGVFNLQSREQRSFDSAEVAVLEREVSSSIVALISAIQTHASYEPARHSSRGYCKKHYMSEYYLPRVAEIVATRRSA